MLNAVGGQRRRCKPIRPSSTLMASERQRSNADLDLRYQRHTLVDVVLVLLIIFMVTAPVLQSGIEVSVPRRAQSKRSPRNAW
jgi:biopolymer transport protein ExbD